MPPPNLDLSLPELLQLTSSSSPRPPLRPRDLTWPRLHAPPPRKRRNLSSRRHTPFFLADDTRRALHLHRPPHAPELERPIVIDRHLVPAATSTNESHDEALGPLPRHQCHAPPRPYIVSTLTFSAGSPLPNLGFRYQLMEPRIDERS
jgi:hypothetical protein